MDKIRVGIVGFGFIGRRHAHMINNNNFFELCTIADIKNKNDLEFDSFASVPFFSSINEMISFKDDYLDLIVISTPNGLHEENDLSFV